MKAARVAVPIPKWTRRGLTGGAVLLVIVAAAVNIAHTRQNAHDNGADEGTAWVVGFIPDVMLVLSVMRLRYDRRSIWAWAGVTGSVGLVAWSALATAGQGHGVGGRIIALVCVTAAIIATGQAHVPHGEDPAITMAHVEALAEDAQRTAQLEILAAQEGARRAVAEAARTAEEISVRAAQETARQAARVEELGAALASAQGALQAAQETALDAARAGAQDAAAGARDATGGARTRAPGRRPTGARQAPAQEAPTPGDVQRRRAARDGYKASVRAARAPGSTSEPWPNSELACALFGCTDACDGGEHRPAPDALKTARKRASDWRREVEQEDEVGAQEDADAERPDATGTAR